MLKRLALLSALLAGCGSSAESVVVTAAELGAGWPLTVPEARLYCNALGERYMAVEGATYALNGKALAAGMRRPDPLVREGAAAAALTERAGGLCK